MPMTFCHTLSFCFIQRSIPSSMSSGCDRPASIRPRIASRGDRSSPSRSPPSLCGPGNLPHRPRPPPSSPSSSHLRPPTLAKARWAAGSPPRARPCFSRRMLARLCRSLEGFPRERWSGRYCWFVTRSRLVRRGCPWIWRCWVHRVSGPLQGSALVLVASRTTLLCCPHGTWEGDLLSRGSVVSWWVGHTYRSDTHCGCGRRGATVWGDIFVWVGDSIL